MKTILLLALTIAISIPMHAQLLINYQGRIDSNGVPLNTPRDMTFSFYRDSSSLDLLWAEPQTNVPVTNGVFNVYIGRATTGGVPADTLVRNYPVWLQVQVGSQILSPRVRFGSVPYAARAERLGSSVVVDSSGDISISSGAGNTDLRINNSVAPVEGIVRTGSSGGINRMVVGTLTPHDLALSAGNATWMTIKQGSGNVGIGTINPGNKLDVMGGVAFQGNHLYLRNTDSPVGDQTWGMVVSSSNGRLNIGTASDTPPGGGSLSFTAITVERAGSVGIGTTNPTSRLEVSGNVAAVNFVSTSDIRFKTSISPLRGSLEKVLALQAVSYLWNSEKFPEKKFPEGRQVGFIAQEIEPIIPEIVNTDKNGFKALEYSHLTALLTEAIKEQQQQIETQRQEIEALRQGHEKRLVELETALKIVLTREEKSINGEIGEVR